MADVPQPPEPELESPSGDSLLAAISREMVRAMKQYYGRGPTKAKSYLFDDLLFVVMRGGALQAERTLLEAGFSDAVREFRQKFENVMAEHLTGAVEQLTERKVVTYQSQVLFEPMVIIEIFVFDEPVSRGAIEETAQALLSGDTGAVAPEDSGADQP
ncbi:MAG TPA: Na-translocating system protein MpsC family protein [Solirubrobacterales bacterium]|nr:Na-translocating system protein MpsC family protein [Solirubrobacterales bacterium]